MWLSTFSCCYAKDAIRVLGAGPEILVDDEFIAAKAGIVRQTHPCEKLDEPVMISKEPWEWSEIDRRIYVYGSVERNETGEALRLWYNRNHLVLLANSTDGLRWQRPALGLFEWNGTRDNNIVLPYLHSPSVVRNDKTADPDQRYQMLGYAKEPQRGYHAAHSADGIDWKLHPRNPVLPGGDTCTLAFDPASGEYLAFHKLYREHRGHKRRLVYLATSPDMQDWSEPQLVLAPDEIDDAQVHAEGGLFAQFYNLSVFPYAGQFLGLVTLFHFSGPPKRRGPLQSGHDGAVDVQLVHSRDGRSWRRCEDRSPVIPVGPAAYDAGCILGVTNGPVVMGNEVWFYYTAITTTHGGFVPEKAITIGLAKWRIDGFVSLGAGADGGTIETVPLRCTGSQLVVNTDARDGSLAVAVLDEHGNALGGFAEQDCQIITGNSIRQPVRWKLHDRIPNGQPLQLRFHLKNAKLFSFAVVK
jgi:hypothetical protein